MKPPYAKAGSQRWLQICVDKRPELLQSALRHVGALGHGETVEWVSPRSVDGFKELRDEQAIDAAGLEPKIPLIDFWPKGGPVWDAIGRSSTGAGLLVEAKANIPEAASTGSKASEESLKKIKSALKEARAYYSPRSEKEWSGLYYQYANRLAYQYFLATRNGLDSRLVFLYFLNAGDVNGPSSETEWQGVTQRIHDALGLPKDLEKFGVFHAYVDVRLLHGLT